MSYLSKNKQRVLEWLICCAEEIYVLPGVCCWSVALLVCLCSTGHSSRAIFTGRPQSVEELITFSRSWDQSSRSDSEDHRNVVNIVAKPTPSRFCKSPHFHSFISFRCIGLIWTKTCYTWWTTWLCFQGHGIKGQSHAVSLGPWSVLSISNFTLKSLIGSSWKLCHKCIHEQGNRCHSSCRFWFQTGLALTQVCAFQVLLLSWAYTFNFSQQHCCESLERTTACSITADYYICTSDYTSVIGESL